jgi:putative membrane protein
MGVLLRWFVSATALLLATYLVPGVSIHSFWSLVLAALVLGLINSTIRPLLIFLTLPITILTLGLFTLVVNGVVVLLVASLVKGFIVSGFGAAVWVGIILGLTSWLINSIISSTKLHLLA